MADDILIKTKALQDFYLSQVSEVLLEIELLDPIVKENQIRDFKEAILNDFFSKKTLLIANKVETLQNPKFEYLTNRMTSENKIKERIELLVSNFQKDLVKLNNSI